MNREIELFKEVTDKVSLKNTLKKLEITPHEGQNKIVDLWDNNKMANNVVAVCGRRWGKSTLASGIIIRELLVPYSRTALIAPLYSNVKIIWQETVKLLYQLGLKPKSINNQAFSLELENGSKLNGVSEDSIESILGNRYSLLVFDEAQSISKLEQIYATYLSPTLSDYGVRADNSFYGRVFMVGTPRSKQSVFYEFFVKEYDNHRWVSVQAPSKDNKMNTEIFLDAMRKSVGELRYRQEYLAQFVTLDSSDVFYAFKEDRNTFKKDDLIPFLNEESEWIAGIDVGFNDSTAYLLVLKSPEGAYYVCDAYSMSQKTTKDHVDAFLKLEMQWIFNKNREPSIRYIDKAAAQTAHDLVITYNYAVHPCSNAVRESVDCLNTLFDVSGANAKPKLFIEEGLRSLIKQILMLQWNPNKSVKDPFKRVQGHHFDLIASLRYAIYSDYKNSGQSFYILN